jgi:dipeptidyl aminopeptidase/acylaminoacyl peptidase
MWHEKTIFYPSWIMKRCPWAAAVLTGSLACGLVGGLVSCARREHGVLLATIPAGCDSGYVFLTFSPAARRVAYSTRPLGRETELVFDGDHAGPEYHQTYPPVFGGDGTQLAYKAQVYRREKTGGFEVDKRTEFMVLNGIRQQDFSQVMGWCFSPNGRTLAYAAENPGGRPGWSVVVGGIVGPPFDCVSGLVWSPDGSKLAYRARIAGREFVVVGSERGPEFTVPDSPDYRSCDTLVVHDIRFSSDGRRVIYEAFTGDGWIVVAGDWRSPTYFSVSEPAFSPDGSVVYIVKSGPDSGEHLAFGDSQSSEFEDIGAYNISPDGKRIGFSVRQGTKWFCVLSDRKGPEFDMVTPPQFNAQNDRFAYFARQGEEWFVVADDRRGPAFSLVHDLLFSPTGKTLAYIARDHGQEFVVIGSRRGPTFDEISSLTFSPDGSRLSFGAKRGRELWWMTLDID